MSVIVPPGTNPFQNGQPAIHYDECYSCFEDRGILFRLVDTTKKRWAFYNDTKDLIIRVRAQFGAGSEITPLLRTDMVDLPPPVPEGDLAKPLDGTAVFNATTAKSSGKYAYEATLTIDPGFTELFIEGTVNGFTMDFTTESAPAKDVAFENGGPTCTYDKIYKCFKDTGNGLLFRLVNEREGFWAFYNDTKDYTMKVVVDFDYEEEVTPLGNTQVVQRESGSQALAGSIIYSIAIAPGKTEMFIKGFPSIYKLSFAAEPIKAGEPAAPAEAVDEVVYENGKPDPAIIPHLSHVYKCFKEHGNGLLFRCVDDVNKIWAFYNDTKDYVMNVNVRFPPNRANDEVAFAPNVQMLEDTEVPGGFIAAAQAQPLETVPFLVGDLTGITYELAFSAQQAEKNAPEAHPAYENGVPDITRVGANRIDEVYKCFKEHGNGLLFRLVTYTTAGDRSVGSWAFYNDTKDTVMHVKVSFAPKAKVKSLGRTKIDSDEEMGFVYVLEVMPGTTEPFVEGEVGSFTTKFTATKVK